jgi:anti-sigma regulatory factor (Ser/Thr protein kinase)
VVTDRTVSLHGLGVPAERVQKLAYAWGLESWPGPASPCVAAQAGARVILLIEQGQDEALEEPALWEPPYYAWIEANGLDETALAGAAGRASAADLFANLSTCLANHMHLAGRVVAAIEQRHRLSDDLRDDAELALHEAISNAVVHGNLQVEGMKGLTVSALDRFSFDLASRLSDPAFAERRLELAAWLTPDMLTVDVTDQGKGFNVPRSAGSGASGRGLDLITALTHDYEMHDGGRRIRMRFKL